MNEGILTRSRFHNKTIANQAIFLFSISTTFITPPNYYMWLHVIAFLVIGFFRLVLREVNANICLTQGCVVGIVFSDIQPKPFQKILGNFFCKALQSALWMIQMLFGLYTMLLG